MYSSFQSLIFQPVFYRQSDFSYFPLKKGFCQNCMKVLQVVAGSTKSLEIVIINGFNVVFQGCK